MTAPRCSTSRPARCPAIHTTRRPSQRPFAEEVGRDPGRLRIGWTARTADGDFGHPDCVAAVEDAAALCASLGHDVVETTLPGLTPEVGAAIGTVFNSAAAWIIGYWVRHVGREPGPDELEPLTRAYWEASRRVTAGDYLLAIEDAQLFGRGVASFLSGPPDGVDLFMTPTLSEPPLPIGAITSTDEDPWRALKEGGRTVRYAAIVANITGNPAMSLPLWWNGEGMPIGVHVLGRFGEEATLFRLAGQLEAARPWAHRIPPVHASAV